MKKLLFKNGWKWIERSYSLKLPILTIWKPGKSVLQYTYPKMSSFIFYNYILAIRALVGNWRSCENSHSKIMVKNRFFFFFQIKNIFPSISKFYIYSFLKIRKQAIYNSSLPFDSRPIYHINRIFRLVVKISYKSRVLINRVPYAADFI